MRKVKITGLPEAKKGGNTDRNNAMFFPWPVLNGTALSKPDVEVNKTLKPVPREEATLEAEKGETIVTDMNNDGITEHYTIGGERHSNGGTPLNVPKNSFIFSRDKSMAIKDQEILKDFGTSGTKTPADISKKYDINEFRRILADPDTDKLQKKTAEQMIANYNMKLAKLALAQESIKGFPNGIPEIAMPYLMATEMDPSQMLGTQGIQEQPLGNMAKYGGQYKFATEGEVLDPGTEDITPHKSKTVKGKTTPTGQNSDSPYTQEEYDQLFKGVGIDTKSVDGVTAQKELYKKADPYHKAYMWGIYGDTNKGNTKATYSKYKPLPGENYTAYRERMSQTYKPEDLNKELDKYADNFADGKNGARVAFMFNEPNITQKPAPETPTKDPVTALTQPATTPQVSAQPHLQGVPAEENDQYWLQDIVKTAGATRDFFGIKKYGPWQATPGVDYVDPTFYDPNREIAATNEQMNIGTQGAQIFTGPQAYNARFSQMQGQGAKSIADTMSRINNLNVGVANQTEGVNTDIYNQHSQNLAGLQTQLYDKGVIVNQQFDNAKNMARQNMRQSYIDAITNKNQTASLNEMFPQFNINPLEGGRVRYTGKEAPLDTNVQEHNQMIELAKKYKDLPGMSWKDALDAAQTEMTGKRGNINNPDYKFEQYQKLLAAQNNG